MSEPQASAEQRTLIYVDTAYTLRVVRSRRHEEYWHARHSRGYFDTVWGVHPMADVPDREVRRKLRIAKFSPKQLLIEGTSQSLPLPSALLPLNFLVSQAWLLGALVKRARRRGVSAVFANDPLYSGLFGLALARRLKVPLIVFVPQHYDENYEATGALGNPRLFRFRKIEQAVMRSVFRNCDMVFAAADNVARLALKYGACEHTIERLSHGKYVASCHLADPASRISADAALREYAIAAASDYLIFVGRFTPVKHPWDALRAMKIVLDARPNTIGIMAGEGELRGALEAEARALGIAGRMAFPGLIDQPSLSIILPHCITLSPLTGMALIECSLAGSPVIAYDRDWQSEFVEDGVSGYVVPFGNWETMGRRVLEVLDDPELRRRFATEGRKRALALVDIEGNSVREHAAFDRMFERFARKHGHKRI